MLNQYFLLIFLIGTVVAKANDNYEDNQHHPQEDLKAAAEYDFAYSIRDDETGDVKSHREARRGDVVEGKYSVVDPDGHLRTVTYTVDDHSGFNAKVERQGIEGYQVKEYKKQQYNPYAVPNYQHSQYTPSYETNKNTNNKYEVKYEAPVLIHSQTKHNSLQTINHRINPTEQTTHQVNQVKPPPYYPPVAQFDASPKFYTPYQDYQNHIHDHKTTSQQVLRSYPAVSTVASPVTTPSYHVSSIHVTPSPIAHQHDQYYSSVVNQESSEDYSSRPNSYYFKQPSHEIQAPRAETKQQVKYVAPRLNNVVQYQTEQHSSNSGVKLETPGLGTYASSKASTLRYQH